MPVMRTPRRTHTRHSASLTMCTGRAPTQPPDGIYAGQSTSPAVLRHLKGEAGDLGLRPCAPATATPDPRSDESAGRHLQGGDGGPHLRHELLSALSEGGCLVDCGADCCDCSPGPVRHPCGRRAAPESAWLTRWTPPEDRDIGAHTQYEIPLGRKGDGLGTARRQEPGGLACTKVPRPYRPIELTAA